MANKRLRDGRKARRPVFGGLALALALAPLLAAQARAMDCNADIAALTKKRQGVIDQLNAIAKGNKGQLDPVAACPKLKTLVAVERQLADYFTKNKDWCNVPDNAVENISQSAQKSSSVANQACKIAVQMKRAQEQQATGGGLPPAQKLPTGPL
ncbi:hypothetical protein [Methylocella sp.]|uniref:hypothetical protein n=1 Tax=Methylocella sp. TaxID=1978226 RepID=UPI00378488AD